MSKQLEIKSDLQDLGYNELLSLFEEVLGLYEDVAFAYEIEDYMYERLSDVLREHEISHEIVEDNDDLYWR